MSEPASTSNKNFFPGLFPESMFKDAESNLRKFGKIRDLFANFPKVKVGATPNEVVFKKNKMKLLHYLPTAKDVKKPPILIVYALVNRPYILDLQSGRSVIQTLVGHGFDTYLIDWGVPSDFDRNISLTDYLEKYVKRCVETVKRESGCDQVTMIGYCMGGTMGAMYTSLHQSDIKNLILMAAPIEFSSREGLLYLWSDKKVFDVDKFIDTFGNCPADFLQWSFLLLKPVQNFFTKYINFYENVEDDRFLENFLAMEAWVNDNIPVAGEAYREFIKFLFQENRLVKGELRMANRPVKLQDIYCPVLNLIAEKDFLVPPESSAPFNNYVSSTDKEIITFPSGHIGLSVGSGAMKVLWPKVCAWLDAHL
ncbi:class III poly(R)-hydroxyalkanoic acid synthase subunit PhaC [bacterium]|nr:class III poly(R)-hydroxyalkanoic acid synthase subunit PhaC [bacterium]